MQHIKRRDFLKVMGAGAGLLALLGIGVAWAPAADNAKPQAAATVDVASL
ncbi:MAG: twin-arginine translocation signal domain-containing protein, partial [Planctomycetes bacterium]|nr:twin-arginine translocation signal domain-containing protein [Planctomycetota bacterium]